MTGTLTLRSTAHGTGTQPGRQDITTMAICALLTAFALALPSFSTALDQLGDRTPSVTELFGSTDALAATGALTIDASNTDIVASLTSAAGVDASFTATSALVTGLAGTEPISLTTSAIGDIVDIGTVERTANGVIFDRGIVDEWYTENSSGLEHGYTIDAPVSAGTDLAITVDIDGGVPTLIDSKNALLTGNDGAHLFYSGLLAFDANGLVLPSEMTVVDGAIVLEVDTTGAVYPVTVDPILTEDQKLSGNVNATNAAALGESIAIDGNRLVIGAPVDEVAGDLGAGAVQIWERADELSPWVYVTSIESPIGEATAFFGTTVALTGDRLAIAAASAASTDAIHVYEESAPGTWTLLGSSPIQNISGPADSLGADIAWVTPTRLLASMPANNGSFGQVAQYDFDGTDWNLTTTITQATPDLDDEFGYSIATSVGSGGTALLAVGSPGDDDAGTDAGSVHIFEDTGAGYGLVAKLAPAGTFNPGWRVGTSVDIDGEVIGAGGLGGQLSGDPYNLYLIEETAGAFSVTYAFNGTVGSDTAGTPGLYVPNDYIAVTGRNLLAGRPGGGGQVGVFRSVAGGQLELVDQIQPTGRVVGDAIGLSVDVEGHTVVTGARGDDDTGGDNGAAYSTRVALTATFVGIDGDYDTPGNWDIGLVPDDGDTAVIPDLLPAVVSISESQSIGILAAQTVDPIIIETGGELRIDGLSSGFGGSSIQGDLEVDGTLVLDAQAGAVSIDAVSAVNINGQVTKTGIGTFTVTPTTWNSFLGGSVDIEQGELAIDANDPAVEAASVNIAAGATLRYFEDASLDADGIYDVTIAGPSGDPANFGRVFWDSGGSSDVSGLIRSTLDGYTPVVGDDYRVLECNSSCDSGAPTFDVAPFEATFTTDGVNLALAAPVALDSVVSIDGEWAAVGVPGADAVFVLFNDDGTWTDVQTIPAPTAGDGFGAQVSLAVPALAISSPGSGTVDVYELDSGTFVAKQQATGLAADGFGAAIDAEDDVLIVGSPDDDSSGIDAGRAVAYDLGDLDNGLPVIFDITPVGSGDRFGLDVAATTGDFWVSATNGPGVPLDGGAVYRLNTTGVTTATVISLAPTAGAGFGAAIDADQGRLVASENPGTASNAQLFDVGQGQSTLLTTTASTDVQVDISGDRIYVRFASSFRTFVLTDEGTDGIYTQETSAPDGGVVVTSIAADGDLLFRGQVAPDSPTEGLSYTDFVASAAFLPPLAPVPGKLFSNTASSNDQFGSNVAIDGDTMVVTSTLFDGTTRDSGAAYVFQRSGGVWTQTQRITASIAGAVAVDGDVLALALNNGIVLIYDRSDAASPFQGFNPIDVTTTARSLSIDGDTLVVGVPEAGDGQVNVYDNGYTNWTSGSEQVLGAPALNGDDTYGHQVDISGNRIAIGAPASGSINSFPGEPGFVDSFTRPNAGAIFTLESRFIAPSADTLVGWSVAVDGDVVVAGAPRDGSGSVSVIDAPTGIQVGVLADSINNGYGYALDADSGVIVVGDFSSTQRAYDANTLAQVSTLVHSDFENGDNTLGSTPIAASNGTVVSGARLEDSRGRDAGAVYTFGVPTIGAPELTFDFDVAAGSPTSVTVAPTGIAVTEFNASVVDGGNDNDANLASTPLSAVELDDTPLSATTIGETPLSATVLESAPLSATPLIAIDVEDGWPNLLDGTDLENVPLQDLTFGQALSDPVVFGRIQALPLSAVDVRGTPLSAVPLSAVVLGSTPLSAVPLSATGSTVTWCEVITPYFPAGTCTTDADLTDVTLLEATLAGTPLSAVPLSAVPLSAVPLSATPLSAVPLSATDLLASPLSAVPLSAVPLSAVGLDATPLSAVPLSAVPLSAVPLSATDLDSIDVNGTPLSAVPLSATGIAGAPLSAVLVSIPLSAVPLSATEISGVPLSATPLSAVPLSAVVLGSLPLSAVPLSATDGTSLDWCDFLASLDGDANCEHGVDPATTTLAELSVRGVPLSAVPLSATPLSATDLVGLPLSAVPLSAVPLSAVSLEALDLALIDLQDTPLSAVDPSATPLSAVPLSAVPLSAVDIVGSPLSAVPLSAVPLSATQLSSVELGSLPLSAVPLSATPLSAVPLSATPLSATPLSAVDIVASPLSAVPLSAVPLSAVSIDCTLVDCDVDTLGDAVTAGAIDLTVTLGQLQPALDGLTFADLLIGLPGTTQAELVAALAGSGLTLADLTDLNDLGLGDLPSTLPLFDNMTLADLDGALFDISIADLVGALIDPTTGFAFSDSDATNALRTALDRLDLDIADVESLGNATLGELLTGPLGDGAADVGDLTLGDLGPLLGFISIATVIEYLGFPFTADDLEPRRLGDVDPEDLGNLLIAALFGAGITEFDTLELGEFIADLDAQGLLEGFTLGDLLLLLSGASNLPFGGFDFTSVDVDSLPEGTVPPVTFDASFTLDSPNPRAVEVRIDLPGTASYVAGSAQVSSGFPISGSPLEPVVDDNTLTWNFTSVASNDDYSVTFDVLPTVSLGSTTLAATARVPGTDVASTGLATIEVEEGLENNDFPPPFVTPASENTIYLTYINDAEDIDVFEVAVQDNDRLVVELSNLDADLDMALYVNPINNAVGAPLTDTNGQGPVFPITDPDQNGADAEPLQDFVRLDEIDTDLELIAVSNTAGLDNELINTDRLPAGTYYIQVFGANGAVNVEPAALQLDLIEAENRPVCQPRGALSVVSPGVAPTLTGTSANTLILINESRIEQLYGADARNDVTAQLDELTDYLAANPGLGVDPIVVPVDAYASIRTAYDNWDAPADPELACDPDTANAVVSAINDEIVDPLRDQLTHVMIIGGDDQIPMARLDDATAIANEYDFRHEFDGDLAGANPDGANAFTSTFWEKRFLSDEPYGEAAAQSLGNRYLYVSDLALGRLVETPDDIIGALEDFIIFDGTLDVTSATVLGYDFLSDGSEQIADDLAAGGLVVDSRYADGEDNGTIWDQAIALSQLTAAGSNELISLNAHFDHYRALPAAGDQVPGFEDNLIATDVAAQLPDGLTQSLVFSMGCHSGLAVPDNSILGTNTDWAQQIAQTGGIYVANTGFGYGDTETVAYTEQLMANFARFAVDPTVLDGASAPTTIGQALTFAKNQYAADLGVFSVYDEKALMESTFYGVPFFQVGLAGTPAPAAPDNDPVPDSNGTEVLNVTATATNDINVVDRGTYYSNSDDDGNELTIVAPGRPIQPSVTTDVSVVDPGDTTTLDAVAHGALVLSMESTYLSLADPVVATPVFDEAADQPEPALGDVTFPAKPITINTTTTPSGTRQSLVVATGQYRSSADTQRLDDDLDIVVYYADPSVTDFTAPALSAVNSTLDGGLLTVSLTAADAAGVDRIYLLVGRNPGAGTVDWVGLDLAPQGGNKWAGSLQLGAGTSSAAFVVQAKDANGNVGVATNKATNFTDQIIDPVTPPAQPGLDIEVDDTSLDAASGWYTNDVSVTVDSDGVPASYSIDGAASIAVAPSGTFTIAGNGVHTYVVTTANGKQQTGSVRIDTTGAPVVALGTPTAGSTYAASAQASYDVVCSDPSLTVCELSEGGNPVEVGDALPTIAGDYVLSIHAEDSLGNETDLNVNFTIEGATSPEPPTVTDVSGPVVPTNVADTIAVTASFDDPDGDSAGAEYTVVVDFGDSDPTDPASTSTTCTATSGQGTTTEVSGATCSVAAPTSGTSGSVDADFVYAAAGVYSVTVTVTDEAGLSSTDVFEFVVVYDPGAGRVSGAGLYVSGPEAQPGDPDYNLALFGFTARYRNGADRPTGRTQLRVLSEFSFRSVSYDYLIVNDSIAVAEGVGKVQGHNGFRFRVQAIDQGRTDFFQISIWDDETGEIFYDNGVIYADGDLVLWGGIRIRG